MSDNFFTYKPTLGRDISWLLKVAEKTEDSRVVPLSDNGGVKDLCSIHILNLLRIAEKTEPDETTISTPYNFSQKEYKFIVNLFDKFFNLQEDWVLGRIIGYYTMRYPEERFSSPKLQKLYAGFMDYWYGLSDISKIIILNSFDAELAYKAIEKIEEKKQERIIQYIEDNKFQNWKIINTFARSWFITFTEQYSEALKQKPALYTPKLKRNQHSTMFVKAVAHELMKDQKIDSFEKEAASLWLQKRFESFETLTDSCIEEMVKTDISRKDTLFYLALTGKLDNTEVPLGVLDEVADVKDKTEKAKTIMKQFEGSKIDFEELNLIAYALSIIGIRGKANIELTLSGYNFDKEDFERLRLHNVKILNDYIKNPSSLKKCGISELEYIANRNPHISSVY